jgi:hypothetical protein
MKRLLVLCCAAAVLVLAGCDPFGTDETRAYVTGMVYADSNFADPAEGVTIYMVGDSINTYSQSTLTDANGEFFMEIQLYPAAGGEGVVGYVMPDHATLGLEAHYMGGEYIYASIKQDPLTIETGDTLTVWPISLFDIAGGK